MITKKELLKAIEDIQGGNPNYQACQKLATFYTIYNNMYGALSDFNSDKNVDELNIKENAIDLYGESEFLKKIYGKPLKDVFIIIDELINAVMVLNPKLYESFMRKL